MKKTGRPRKFSEQQQELIYRKYIAGVSQLSLSIEYDCAETTIGKICRERGGSFHNKTLAMLLHDWNAGTSIDKLRQKYKYKSGKYLNTRICALRKRGMPFERRGCVPTNSFVHKRKRDLDAEMLNRQLPIKECEQVFADGVRESVGAG